MIKKQTKPLGKLRLRGYFQNLVKGTYKTPMQITWEQSLWDKSKTRMPDATTSNETYPGVVK